MKLMTKAILDNIPALYSQDGKPPEEVKIHAKFFHPSRDWTWYATEYDPKTRTFFGFIDGLDQELGYFSLDELESVKVGGLGIERDLYFGDKKTLADVDKRQGRSDPPTQETLDDIEQWVAGGKKKWADAQEANKEPEGRSDPPTQETLDDIEQWVAGDKKKWADAQEANKEPEGRSDPPTQETLDDIEQWVAGDKKKWADAQEANRVSSDEEGKRFLFWDGLSSFTMSDDEILNLGTEEDEPDLYDFARDAKMGDVMFSENFGGPDVERVPADYRYGDERFSDADRILAGEIRAWAMTHPNEKQAEKFADDLLRRGEKRAVTEILLESEGMQIEQIMNSILHDHKDKDRAWAKEQFLRAWNNTDAELLPTGDYPGAVVREILQQQFDIGSGWNSDDIRTRNLIHGFLENQGKYGWYSDFPEKTFQKIWDEATKHAPRMDAEGRGDADPSKEAIKESVVQWVADEIDDKKGFPGLKHMKYDPHNPDWGHVHALVRRALERYREDNPIPKETAKDDSPMTERGGVANKMYAVISDAMLDIQDDWGGRQGEMDGPTMEAKLRQKLGDIYATGADTNVFPHEEIAEAIGESPQAVDGYFADDFNIDAWHQEIPKEGPVFSEAPEPSMYWNPKHNVWVADLASSQLIHPFTEEFGKEGAVEEISHIEHEGPPKVDGLKVLYESYPDGTHITGELRFDHDENSWVIQTTGEWADYFRQQGMSDYYNLQGGWPVHSYDMSEAKSPRDFDKNWKPEKEKGDSQGQDKNYPHHDAVFHYKGDAYVVVGFDPDKKENIVKNRETEKTFILKPDQITTLITAESKIDLQAFGEEKPRRSRPPVLRTGKKGGKLKSVGLKKIKAPRVGKVKSYMDSITGRKFTRRAKGGMPKSKRFTKA